MKKGKAENGEWLICNSLNEAMENLNKSPLKETIDKIFVIGGSQIYNEAIQHPSCSAVHLTEVEYPNESKLDTFFPTIEPERFTLYSSGPIEKESGLRFQRLSYTATSLSPSDISNVVPSAAPAHEEYQVKMAGILLLLLLIIIIIIIIIICFIEPLHILQMTTIH